MGSPLPEKSPVDKLIPWLFGQHLANDKAYEQRLAIHRQGVATGSASWLNWTQPIFGRIRDWWISERPDINQYTYDEALAEAQRWHRELVQKMEAYEAKVSQRGELVMEFPDGVTWYLLEANPNPSSKSLKHLMKIGDALGHCYGSRGGARTATWYRRDYDLYTLYDASGEPHLTVSVPADPGSRRRRGDGGPDHAKVTAFYKALGMSERHVEEANLTGNKAITGGRWMPYWRKLATSGLVGVDPVEFFSALSPGQQESVLEVIRLGTPPRTYGERRGSFARELETESYWLDIEGLERALEGPWGPLHDAVLDNSEPAVQNILSYWFTHEDSDQAIRAIPDRFWNQLEPHQFHRIVRSMVHQRGSLVAQRRARVKQLVDRAREEGSPRELAALWLSSRNSAGRRPRRQRSIPKASKAEEERRAAFQQFTEKETARVLDVSQAVRQRVAEEVLSELLPDKRREMDLHRQKQQFKRRKQFVKKNWLLKLRPKKSRRTGRETRRRQAVLDLVEGGVDARDIVVRGLKKSPAFFTQKQLTQLWRSHPEVRQQLLTAINIPERLVLEGGRAKGARVRAAALKSSKASPALWRRHLDDPSVMVRRIASASLSGELAAKWLDQYGLASPGLRGDLGPAQAETLKFLRKSLELFKSKRPLRPAIVAYLKRLDGTHSDSNLAASALLLRDTLPPSGYPHWGNLRKYKTRQGATSSWRPASGLAKDWWRVFGVFVYGVLGKVDEQALYKTIRKGTKDFSARLDFSNFQKHRSRLLRAASQVLKEMHEVVARETPPGPRYAVEKLEKELGGAIPDWLRGPKYRHAVFSAVLYMKDTRALGLRSSRTAAGMPSMPAVRSAVAQGIASGKVAPKSPKARLKPPRRLKKQDG